MIPLTMTKRPGPTMIRLRGARQNNLKQIDLDLPLGQLIVVTGLSGSGKSSLAFDTLFAEGQRRYIETFSPYARQFLDRMDKPQADHIEGIPPAIAVEQRNTVRTTRSTVGTMTEICDYAKLVWTHLAQLYCRQCGLLVRRESPDQIWDQLAASHAEGEILIGFDLPLTDKLPVEESLALIAKQGYQRLLLQNQVVRLETAAESVHRTQPPALTIIQDRLKLAQANRARFVEACEQAYHFGKGRLAIYPLNSSSLAPQTAPQAGYDVGCHPQFYSSGLHCATCDLEYREPSPALFSFNHPLGACPTCHGFGRIISIDYQLAVPDRTRTLAEGLVRPWQSGFSAECQEDLMKFCRRRGVPIHVPFRELPRQWQDWVLYGDADYGKDAQHEWPHAWYGVKGYFRWLESKSYKMHVRVLLSRYRAYSPCPDCQGKRFQPEALLYKITAEGGNRANGQPPAAIALSLADFYQLPIRDALKFIEQLNAQHHSCTTEPIGIALGEVRSRLGYLVEVGLGYLTLDRPTRTLSGGETERVHLTTCLGTRLVNTLFILDEPSVGLHTCDTDRLVRILQHLRDMGNTVVVVEHEAGVMRAANQIVDLGPGSGEAGGRVIFQGSFAEIMSCPTSLTGQYLSGRKRIQIPPRRPVQVELCTNPGVELLLDRAVRSNGSQAKAWTDTRAPDGHSTLVLGHVSLHNLKDLTVQIPLNRFVCVTGVSGSGKSTLVREALYPVLSANLQSKSAAAEAAPDSDQDEPMSAALGPAPATIRGHEHLGRVVLVDQAPLGKTPRSNPAVYSGAFEPLRKLFAQTTAAKQEGLDPSSFSFNSRAGQCERCHGAGFEKIEMQFLSDVYVRCPDCQGRRYRSHILKIKLSSRSSLQEAGPLESGMRASQESSTAHRPSPIAWSIADLLEATVDDVLDFLADLASSRPVQEATQCLKLLQEVGLGYLRLGQPINTLSGGESQRLKLVRHLADFAQANWTDSKPTMFLFDEPTTGLHFDDVRVLLRVFQRLVKAGHSVLVIEHHLDVIKCADWVIDLGPEAGDQGGEIVVQGTPEQIAACLASHTGQALRQIL